MSKPEPAAFTGRVVFEGTFGGLPWANVMWVLANSPSNPSGGSIASLAAGMYNQYEAHFLPLLQVNFILEKCSVTYYTGRPQDVILGEYIKSTPGAQGTDISLPASVAIVISWLSNAYWRGGKPRTYLCGLNDSMLAGTSEFKQTTVDAFEQAGAAFLAGTNSLNPGDNIDVSLCLQSFFSKNPNVTRPAVFPITGVRVGRRIDSQRRRVGREVA